MNGFKKIEDIKEYVNNSILTNKIILAKKTKCVKARQGNLNELVETYTNGILETINKVKIGEDNELDWILTKLDSSNTSWIAPNNYFVSNYELVNDDIYKPKDIINKFIKVNENISFIASWGEEMNLKKGGYLKITDINDIVAIQENDFLDTYEIVK